MSALRAAATLAEACDWTLSNLQIHKLLYIAQMFHMGENDGATIFQDDFEAWQLGPVIPQIYGTAKMFGKKPVTTLFTDKRLLDGTGKEVIERVANDMPDKRPWKLVSITHWNGGAWAKHYAENEFGCVIPKEDILDEYRARAERTAEKQAVTG